MKRFSNKFGFTLIETLIVIGVIAVLCAISIPGTISAKKSLDILEVNTTAKELFVAAQNKLTSMKENGQLNDVLEKMQGFETKIVSNQNLYYQGDGDDVLKEYLLSNGIFSNIKGSYVVEINPITGDINSVFYWTQNDDLKDVYLEGKDDSETVIDALVKLDESSREALAENTLIGYYSAKDTTAPCGMQQFEPEIKIINGNDLYLSVIQTGIGQIPSFNLDNLYIYLTFEDEHNHKNKIEISSASKINEFKKENDSNTLELYFLLDSCDFNNLSSGKINYLFNETNNSSEKILTEGDNIKVTVSLKYEGENLLITSNPAKGTATFNGLFGTKKDSGSDSPIEIVIWNLRHLKNIAKIKDISSTSFSNKDISIIQTLDIDGDYRTWKKNGADEFSAIIPTLTRNVEDFSKIESIELASTILSIDATAASGVHTIKNIELSKNGLFKEINNCYLLGITVINPTFNSTGNSDNVGVLAGTINDGILSKCGVYFDGISTNTLSGENKVGGIAGSVTGNSIITSCYSNIYVKGTSQVGGLFGYTDSDVTITNCYSSGKAEGKNKVGGFVGYANNTLIYNCFTTSNVNADSTAGGFIGAINVSSSSTGSKLIVGKTYKIKSNATGQYLQFNQAKKKKDAEIVLTTSSTSATTNFLFTAENLSKDGYAFLATSSDGTSTTYHLCNKNGNVSNNNSWQLLIAPIEYNGAYYFISFKNGSDPQTYWDNKDNIAKEIANGKSIPEALAKYGITNQSYLSASNNTLTWTTSFSTTSSTSFSIEGETMYTGAPLIKNCYSYGAVNASKSIDDTIGGFAVCKYDNAFEKCYFLRDTNYNSQFTQITTGGIQSQTKNDWKNDTSAKPMIANGTQIIKFQGLDFESQNNGTIEIDKSSNIKFYWGNIPSFMAS